VLQEDEVDIATELIRMQVESDLEEARRQQADR
jgi:hypothetical protein